MCGRFALTLPSDAMAGLFDAAPANDLPPLPNYNICPTNDVHAVVSRDGTRHLEKMRWGFLPRWYSAPGDGPLLINARAETLAEKPAFRSSARTRRCLVPASGFFEWTKDSDGARLPWYIYPEGSDVLAFGGVWRIWENDGLRHVTCAIVTTAANRSLSGIHHRMPLVLAPSDWPLWLGEAGHGAARLMKPAPEEALGFHRVSTKVNSNRASGAGLIAPLAA